MPYFKTNPTLKHHLKSWHDNTWKSSAHQSRPCLSYPFLGKTKVDPESNRWKWLEPQEMIILQWFSDIPMIFQHFPMIFPHFPGVSFGHFPAPWSWGHSNLCAEDELCKMPQATKDPTEDPTEDPIRSQKIQQDSTKDPAKDPIVKQGFIWELWHSWYIYI